MLQPMGSFVYGNDVATNGQSSLIKGWVNQWEVLLYKQMVQPMGRIFIKLTDNQWEGFFNNNMMVQPMGINL